MQAETRKWKIYESLRQHGSVHVTELRKAFSASDMTIRRDLQSMAQAGLLKRVHGGAVLADADEAEQPFRNRQVEELDRKLIIAALARGMVSEGQTIFLDGSTTCYELAKQLANDAGVRVVTNSLAVLLELRGRSQLEVTSLGGVIEQDGNTLDGPLAIDNAEQLSVDVCFFSAYGFTSRGISNPGLIGTSIKKAMIRNAQRSILLADATKFGRKGFIKFCNWSDVDMLVSDSLSEQELEPIAKQSVEIMVPQAVAAGDEL